MELARLDAHGRGRCLRCDSLRTCHTLVGSRVTAGLSRRRSWDSCYHYFQSLAAARDEPVGAFHAVSIWELRTPSRPVARPPEPSRHVSSTLRADRLSLPR